MRTPSDSEKKAVWDAYHARKPVRVPLRWNVNSRIVLLNPALNPEGYTYAQYFADPHVALTVQSRFEEYIHGTLSRTCDIPSAPLEAWVFHVESQNVYDAAYFGCKVEFEHGQVPSAKPIVALEEVDDFLARDFSRPLENPWIRDRLAFREALVKEAQTFRHLGRRGDVVPFRLGFDGPLTVAAMIMGQGIFTLLGMDPPKARRVLETITRAALARNQALAGLADGWRKSDAANFADDSIQLIRGDMYREWVMPVHAFWYDEVGTPLAEGGRRSIHLCGDATRHFKMIRDELGVTSFDTGFPVDHGRLRAELGEDVEISGGPTVASLEQGTPASCAATARAILQSGVMRGGRFVLQEGNNLPPCVPLENLAAVYETCREFGRYN